VAAAEPRCPEGTGRGFRDSPRRRNGAPLIAERAATRGRVVMEGRDEHAGAERAWSVRAPTCRTPLRRTTRPGTRTLVADLRAWGLDERPRAALLVAGNDAPLIDEHAATRGSSATEGGDEHAGAKRHCPLRASFANARGARRDQGRGGSL
jgi:hypothetical protein